MTQEELLHDYMIGLPIQEIADTCGVSREAIYARLRQETEWGHIKRQVAQTRTSNRLLELRSYDADIIEGWIAGVTMLDLAEQYNTDRDNISSIIKEVMGSTKRNFSRDAQIIEEYRAGITQSKLSEKYKISQPCISRIVNALVEESIL